MGNAFDYTFQNGTWEPLVFEGREAGIVSPFTPDGRGSWAIYTEYFGAFPGVAEGLLARGFHIVKLENENRWGTDVDIEARLRFADYLEEERGFSHRCVTIGMSCGGLHAIKYAGKHPDRVSVMYLDAPAVNLLSCPLGLGRAERNEDVVKECLDALGMTQNQMLSYREHPMDFIPVLVAARVPMVLVYGMEDRGVPFEENGGLLAEAYDAAGVPNLVIGKPGCGHHPHGLDDPTPIVDFIVDHARLPLRAPLT